MPRISRQKTYHYLKVSVRRYILIFIRCNLIICKIPQTNLIEIVVSVLISNSTLTEFVRLIY